MGYKNPHYKRDWMRRAYAAHPEKYRVPIRKSRAKKKKRAPGECTACGEIFPLTAEFFVPLRVKGREYLSAECRTCRNKRYRKWYALDPAAQVARALAYVKANPAPKRNRDALRYLRRKKRGNPPWANHDLMQSLYDIAAALTAAGHPHEVDHIYPLIHPLMCGLHVPWNARVVPTALNQAKGNRVPFDDGVVRDCTALL